MIIGIDAIKTVSGQKTGIDNTAYQIIRHLKEADKDNTYFLYANKEIDNALLSRNFITKLVPGKRLWHKFRLPLALYRDKVEVFLELTNSLPFVSAPRKFILVHDLAFKYFPEAYSKNELRLQENTITSAIANNARIIVTLKANKDDLIKHYSVNESNISIVPLSCDQSKYTKNKHAKNPLEFDEPFFLFVGRLEKRKNVANIVRSFNLFKNSDKKGYKLVLAGKPGFGYEEIQKEIDVSRHKSDIVVTGYVSNDDLVNLMSLATSLLYPSYYEGFGLPMLEAFSCELPVITSTAKPLVEVAAHAALCVDPNNIKQISEGMINIASNSKLRDELIVAGKKRVKHFSWKITAEKLKELIDKG